ncbi:PLP-dependent aminotransferase family protein [Aquamicrobium sp. LC103]|uniref:MocR-like ectoine utilization transcription factor EhuR n=1 Tax=Aquamicrobium sp. LC103 TaxID=1120658 RepID=UPI00063EA8D7|nr:PLP-dependent aminotransferase family protein [Aquamicrobium sp. LC103]TKT78319.1 PLP-dependent aminotransferase family protein [Aquamicrobium sp. LC103]
MWTPVLDTKQHGGKSKALLRALSQAIENGELSFGERLPPQRDLAHALNLSFQTVNTAYREAQMAGLIQSVVGRGSFVNARGSSGTGSFILAPGPGDQIDLSVTFLAHHPDLDRMFHETISSISQERSPAWMYQSRPVAGAHAHVAAGLDWLRGMNAGATMDRLFIVNGATHGVFLALSAVAKAGDTVLTENLTENGTIGAAHILGLELHGVESDEQGIIPEALEEACRRHRRVAALVWVPTFGNPTAHLAGPRRREQIAEIADRYDIAVIEDEVYKPLVDADLPAITTMLPKKGFFTTSFTKSVMTGLRVGYLVTPGPYTYRVASAMRCTTWSCAPLMSELATRWLADGDIDDIIRIRRTEAVARQELVSKYLEKHVRGSHPLAPYCWLKIPEGWTETSLAAELQERKILINTSAPFAIDPDAEPGIRVSLSGAPDRQTLERALTIIRDTFEKLPI